MSEQLKDIRLLASDHRNHYFAHVQILLTRDAETNTLGVVKWWSDPNINFNNQYNASSIGCKVFYVYTVKLYVHLNMGNHTFILIKKNNS